MKILHINNFFSDYGGAERVAYNVAKLMRNLGHENLYFATQREPYIFSDENIDTSYFVRDINKKVVRKFDPRVIINTIYNKEAQLKLSDLIHKKSPDIIIVHNFLFNLTASILDVCFKSGIKTLLYIHDVRLFCPGGLLAYNDNYCYDAPCVNNLPINCITNKCKQNKLLPSIFSAINAVFIKHQNYLNKFQYIICPSVAIYNLALKYGIKDDILHVIPHFIDNQLIDLAKNRSATSNISGGYFLYVGRLDHEKGVHFLLQAIKKLPRSIKFKIVGDGDDFKELQLFASEHELENVEFCGKLSGIKLWQYYRNCIAMISPHNGFEAFGLTIIESFIFSKPVIASNIGAAVELVDKSRGILVRPANVEDLCTAISTYASDIDLANEHGKNAYSFALDNFTEDKYQRKLLDIIGFN